MDMGDTDLARADPRLVAATGLVLTAVHLFLLLATRLLAPSTRLSAYLGLVAVAPALLFGAGAVLAIEAEVLYSRAGNTATDTGTRRSARRLIGWATAALIAGAIALLFLVMIAGSTVPPAR
jgi:hypothetical protein